MINGQLNAVSLLTVTPSVTQEATQSVAVTVDGAQQAGGNFAGMLSEIQSHAKTKMMTDSGQAKQFSFDAGAENIVDDLLAALTVLTQSTPTVESSETNAENLEKTVVSAVTPSNEVTDIASQMAMVLSVYAQPGRMPEANIPTVIPVDMPLKVVAEQEQSVAISAVTTEVQTGEMLVKQQPAQKQPVAISAVTTEAQAGEMLVKRQPVETKTSQPVSSDRKSDGNSMTTLSVESLPKQSTNSDAVELVSASSEKIKVEESLVKPVIADRISDVSEPSATRVDTLQRVTVATGQSAVISDSLATTTNKSGQAAPDRRSDANSLSALHVGTQPNGTAMAEQAVAIVAPVTAALSGAQPVKSEKVSAVGSLTSIPADLLQKMAVASEKSAIISATPEKTKVEQVTAESEQVSVEQIPVTISPMSATITAHDEPTIPQRTEKDGQTTQTEKTAASTQPQSGVASAHLAAAASSLESELDIQLSQPQPITVRPATVDVSPDNRFAASVQVHGGIQQLNPEQRIDKVRSGNEKQDTVKEMEQTLQTGEPVGELKSGSGSSQGSDSNLGQSGNSSDSQMLAQNMHTQLGTEHQKVSTLSTKTVSGEAVKLDIPEQIIPQVKERLALHDVKPGSQQITLTLSPDSLGELKMNLNLQGQKLSVEIVTENRTVRDAIVQHTDALKESLARQNITMESFDVTTGGKGSGNQGQNQNAWRELAKQQQQQSWASPRGYQIAQADLPTGQAAYQRSQGQSMLDIHY